MTSADHGHFGEYEQRRADQYNAGNYASCNYRRRDNCNAEHLKQWQQQREAHSNERDGGERPEYLSFAGSGRSNGPLQPILPCRWVTTAEHYRKHNNLHSFQSVV
jgi:hypothetical protein